MPIRKLLSVAGGLIQRIKPCFMMSPLSIAQYFDPHSVKNLQFDYVIFDEASQVKPEDALGALLRGRHAVIMGDTRQLPPTTFFDIMLDVDSDDYDISVIADMESILHLCKRSFPSKMLRWHYRSRHESLIAVSNQEFYDNNLLIYPSPSHDTEDIGLKFIHLPDTVYDRGKSATNRLEAKKVIKYAFDHYKKYGDQKSLGIGTFNIRQQQALLEELELQLKLNPDMEKFFSRDLNEHFFVKNLETIQGDERDVIVVSIGYGFDEEGRLSHNFGPLNQDGGERRLNVLVTRAREKCVVFANFRGRDLDIKNTAPFGLRALKVFLEYAESHNLDYADNPYLDLETPFEDSVYAFLTENGYKVDRQVGCAGFRIDMAIVDPEYPGRYILGIQGDGAMYHSSPVARDRDRLRQQILEGLGWRFYRLWSTDWYRNRAEVQKMLLEHIKELENEERSEKEVIPPIVEEVEVDEIPTEIEMDEVQGESVEIEEEAAPYESVQLNFEIKGELHNRPVGEITQIVVQVVEVESPIHYNEVVRRIRTYWGLKRAGRRIQAMIREAVNLGLLDGQIFEKNGFLFFKNGEIKVRQRSVDPPANIDLISEDEIQEAIKMVIKNQYATATDELIRQVSRLFGIKITRGKTTARIQSVIDDMKKVGEIEERPDGMLDVAKN
jgi:very-short-patch-repair endonuclease